MEIRGLAVQALENKAAVQFLPKGTDRLGCIASRNLRGGR